MQKLNFNVFKKEVSLVERIQFFISFFLRLTLLLACFLAIYTQNWLTFAIALGTLILTFVTAFFESRYKIELPSEFELIITIFIYASIYLGEVHEYYTVFWWWDLVLHTGSGIVLGFIGFIILFVMYRGRKVFASPFVIAVFSFCFAVAMGTIWEIFEFSIDQITGMPYMQDNSLFDTMTDLIVDSLGALLASIVGYIYLSRNRFFIFDRIMNRFIKRNPRIFNRGRVRYELLRELRELKNLKISKRLKKSLRKIYKRSN